MCVPVKWAPVTASGLAPAPSGNARCLARPLLSYNLTSSPSLPSSCDSSLFLFVPPSPLLWRPLLPLLPGFDQPTHATISLALPVFALPTSSHHYIPADHCIQVFDPVAIPLRVPSARSLEPARRNACCLSEEASRGHASRVEDG